MKKRKVLFSITTLHGGGAERVVSVWAGELAERGYDVTVMLAGHVDNEYPLSSTVKVRTVADRYSEYQQLSVVGKYRGKRKILKEEKPDYLISFLSQNRIWTYLTAWGINCKRIETIRNSPWHTDIPNRGIAGRITFRSFEKCYKLLLQSSDQGAFFSDDIQKKTVVIPNPISEIYEMHYKKTFPDNVTTLIAAGRLSEQKNYPLMIDAFARVIEQIETANKPILKIFGAEDSPKYTEKLREYIKEKGIDKYAYLMGRSSHIEDEYANADVFLMSSDFEGMPNALAEAMASRLVCISTDCKTGPRDLIDHGQNGYLVPVGDAKAMAEAIQKVYNMSKQDRISIGDQARKKIMTYCSKENSITKLCVLLK